jgi:hypothetical protein
MTDFSKGESKITYCIVIHAEDRPNAVLRGYITESEREDATRLLLDGWEPEEQEKALGILRDEFSLDFEGDPPIEWIDFLQTRLPEAPVPVPAAVGVREWEAWVHPDKEGCIHFPRKGDAPDEAWELAGWRKIRVREVGGGEVKTGQSAEMAMMAGLKDAFALALDQPAAPTVPDGVPALKEGFAYLGMGPLAHPMKSDGDLLIYVDGFGEWVEAFKGTRPDGHYAARIGSEVWELNTGNPLGEGER